MFTGLPPFHSFESDGVWLRFLTDQCILLVGLPIHDRFGPPGHQIVMLGTDPGTKLELIESAEPLPEVPAPGLSLGFAPENMRKLLSTLEAAGISCPPPMSPNPSLRFYFIQDLDGYVIQLVETLSP